MNCKEVMELSPLYVSGELDFARKTEVRRHLEACSTCAAELELSAEIDGRVREGLMAEPVDTAGLDRRIREGIAAPARRWWGMAASIAAAVVIGAVGLQLSRGVDPVCSAAATDHHREVVNGERRTWQTETTAIEALAERQGIPASSVARLLPEGFRLERGKLCALRGSVFVHLVYSGGGERISVFLRQRPNDAPVQIRKVREGVEHVAYFETERVRAVVVSDRSEGSAMSVAQSAERVL